MKNICYSGAILALTTLLLTGCEALQKEYMKITLREQDKVLTFGREADLEKSVTFSSTTSWTASVQGDWLAVAPDSGNSGSNTITVTTLTANDGNDGRTTEITLTAGGDPATITVVQKGTESTDDPDPNNPDPDEPVVSDEKFITKIRLTGTEDPNDVSDFYIAYDENGNIVGTDRFDIDMEAGECIYYSHVSHTVTGSDGNEITVLTRNEWISTAEMQSEKSEYTSSILLDDNGNAVRQPYAVGDEDLWVEAAYNADNTLKTWIWAGKEYENQEIAARWENGNMVYFNEEDITYAPEYAAPETGFDFGFFLILENWITPASSYMGTPSTNLPPGRPAILRGHSGTNSTERGACIRVCGRVGAPLRNLLRRAGDAGVSQTGPVSSRKVRESTLSRTGTILPAAWETRWNGTQSAVRYTHPYCHREGIQRLAMTIFFIYIRKRHRTGEESERTARPNRAFRPLSDAQILVTAPGNIPKSRNCLPHGEPIFLHRN